MGMTAKGIVRMVGETKTMGANGFTKRELIVETADNPKYPQVIAFECTKDRCALLDAVNIGDAVTVEFDLRGREWRSPSGDTKYFNTLTVWKLEVTQKAAPRPDAIVAGGDGAQDDIPF